MRALLALLVLIAIGASFVLWREEPASPPPPMPEHAAAAAPLPGGSSSPDATGAAAGTVDDATGQRRKADPGAAGPVANVRVVLASTGEPVAGASVRYRRPRFALSESQQLEWLREEAAFGEIGDREPLLQRDGVEVVTDADGRCRVAVGETGTEVIARAGDLFAQGHASAESIDELLLRLRPDRTLRVLVLDAASRPAVGAPLTLVHDRGTTRYAWGVGTTDAAGRLEHRHVQLLGSGAPAESAQIGTTLIGGQTVDATFDPEDPPPQVVLHLPPAGSVKVRVLDIDGKPLDTSLLGDLDVRMVSFEREPETREQRWDAFNRLHGCEQVGENAEATFPFVMLDRYLVVSFAFCMEHGFAGPTAANPHVVVTLRESPTNVIVRATLRRENGQPLTERTLTATLRGGRGMSSRGVRTDAAGRMRCNFGDFGVGDQQTVSVATDGREDGAGISVELTPRKIVTGVNDLGELQLAAQGLLVAGKLVCDPGVDVQVVWLQFERRQDKYWQQESNLTPEWQPDGSFSLRSWIPAGAPIRLVVPPGAYLPVEPIECKAGDRDVEIRLRAAGEATATFLVDDATPLDRLTFRFRRTPPPAADPRARMHEEMLEAMSRHGEPPKDGRTRRRWQGLEPGLYDLTVVCAGVVEPVAAVTGVTVGTGPCPDARLNDVDLRGRVRSFEIRATDAAGQTVVDENAFVIVRGGDDWRGFSLRDGVARLAAPASVDLLVVAPGCRAALVTGVSEPRTIALERATPSTFRVALPSPLPDGATLTLRLVPKLDVPRNARLSLDNGRSMGVQGFFERSASFGLDGTCSVTAAWPGEHTLDATLAIGDERGARLRDLAPKSVVLPAAGEIALTVDRAAYDAALQRLRK